MHRILSSLANRIWLATAAAIILVAASARLLEAPIWGIGVAVLTAAAFRWMIGRVLVPFDRLRDRMRAVSAETARQEALIRGQNSLLVNIGLLRDALYAHGDPKRIGDTLYFGSKVINGNFVEVDHVKTVAGGTATIFLDDVRIATNVQKPDGTRAVGTRLAPGPAFDQVFKNRKTYRGEAEILGVSYLTVYEPIISADAVIGIIYAGVKKEAVAAVDATQHADAIAEMASAVARFEAAAVAKGKAELEAAEQRYEAEEIRRANEILRKASAAAQREVVAALSVALDHLSAGDLTHRVEAAFPSEYVKLKQDFNAAIDKLLETMVAIDGGARTMRQNVSEISQAAEDLSRRTEQQAASLEETAAALNEITAKVRETAQGAQRARDVVLQTRNQAEHSGAVVRRAVAAMADIDASAQQISRIISVIDEIAFQTNLLALNAGVEAARAGESGKGFAVVASEVRSLAQRSADAAKQVRSLISASTSQVGAGVSLVAETGKVLVEIIDGVAEIDKVVESIAVSARDQASGLNEVNVAVTEMDKVTQQNAAMVEESTAASQMLANEAQTLVQLVDRFHIAAPAPPAGARSASRHGSAERPGLRRFA